MYFALAMEFTKDVVPDQEEPHRTTGALLPKFNPRDESAPHVVGTIWVTGWNQIAEMPRNHGPLKSFIVTMEAFLRKGNPMCSGRVIIRQCIRIEKVHTDCFSHSSVKIVAVLVVEQGSDVIRRWVTTGYNTAALEVTGKLLFMDVLSWWIGMPSTKGYFAFRTPRSKAY